MDSLKYESWEQFVTWRLLATHINKGLINIEWICSVIPKINAIKDEHAEAMSSLIEILTNLAKSEAFRSRTIIRSIFNRACLAEEQLVTNFFLSSVLVELKNTEHSQQHDINFRKIREQVGKICKASIKNTWQQNMSLEDKIQTSRRPYAATAPPYFYILSHLMLVLERCEDYDTSFYNMNVNKQDFDNLVALHSQSKSKSGHTSGNESGAESDTGSTTSSPPDMIDDSIQIIGSDDDETVHGKPLPKFGSKTKLMYKFLRNDSLVPIMKQIYDNCEKCEKEHFKILFQIACPAVLPQNDQPIQRSASQTVLKNRNLSGEISPKRSVSSPNPSLPTLNLSGSPNQLKDMGNRVRSSSRTAKEIAKLKNQMTADFEHKRKKEPSSPSYDTIDLS